MRSAHHTKVSSFGFTLIELMITVAIIAVIAAIAIPAYSDYVTRARRADAKTALVTLELAQEKLRANCAFYASVIDDIGDGSGDDTNTCGASSAASDVAHLDQSPDGYYSLSISAATASGYTLVAAPTSAQNDPECLNFVLTKAGSVTTKTNTGSTSNGLETCWQR